MTDMPLKSSLIHPDTTEGQFQAGLGAFFDVVNQMAGQGDADLQTIASGEITPNKALVRVETEASASSDDLTNVQPTVIGSKLLIIALQEPGRTLTLKHNAAGSNNLQLKDGVDAVMTDVYSSIMFRYDSTNSQWVETLRSIAGDANIPAADAGGTADAITVTFTPTPVVSDGKLFLVRAASANATTTPTLNPNAIGAKTIVKKGNVALLIGDIAGANFPMLLEFNAALDKYVLLNPAKISEVDLALSDVTTANASTTMHGLQKKLPNNAAQFLNGQGNYVAPPSASMTTITASGTWTKPGNGSMALIQMWGGGGGGGSAAAGGGGGGGAYIEVIVPLSSLGATEAAVIGNGGAIGANGGNTTFAGFTAYGGALGATNLGGGGGGQTGAPSGVTGGTPLPDTLANGGSLLGGGTAVSGAGGAPSVYGGGSGGGNVNISGGWSVYGGGGGGGGSGTSTGGASRMAGNGGGTGVAGQIPAGGGGRNAAGARGEIRITVF